MVRVAEVNFEGSVVRRNSSLVGSHYSQRTYTTEEESFEQIDAQLWNGDKTG